MPNHEFNPQPTNTENDKVASFAQLQAVMVDLPQSEFNILGLEPVDVGTGQAVCVSSYMTAPTYEPDTFILGGDGKIIHRRNYTQMMAHADYVGLWSKSAEAALYSVQAPFILEPELASDNFSSVVQSVLRNPDEHRYKHYQPIETDVIPGIAMSCQYRHASDQLRIVPTPETILEQTPYGALDDADGLTVRLYGPAGLFVPQNQYLSIGDRTLSQGPVKELTVPVTIDQENASEFNITVEKGKTITVGEAGQLIVPPPQWCNMSWDSSSSSPDFTHNPQLSGEQALELMGSSPELRDCTDNFMSASRKDLLEALPLDEAVSYDRLLTAARLAIKAQFSPDSNLGYRLLGSPQVKEWLSARADEGLPRRARDKDYVISMTRL